MTKSTKLTHSNAIKGFNPKKNSPFKILTIAFFFLLSTCQAQKQNSIWQINTLNEWKAAADQSQSTKAMNNLDVGGEFDLMGDGALILTKQEKNRPFAKSDTFNSQGTWLSTWKKFTEKKTIEKLNIDVIIYGNSIDMTQGWTKFSGNPLLSGSNILLPLNRKNITEQTLLLPEPPGGVPQDQSIIRGKGLYDGKWVLFFNHTPNKWPNEDYWSLAVADSLAPLKRGINPFTIPEDHYPLFGPIDNQAPNDWIEIDGILYAPDETHQSMSHLWMSKDYIKWTDLGMIKNKVGTDPGICYDGEQFHLFSENGNTISHSILYIDSVKAYGNQDVLDVKDHTGDADVSFFNNQWHMFVDDGEHLHYKISYAVTFPSQFPYGWKLVPEIYGPHNPEGQDWDNDTPEGNDFGTGDADIALEGTTLYLFTERPIGAAYRELTEVFNASDQSISVMLELDSNADGSPDDSTEWIDIRPGQKEWTFSKTLTGNQFRLNIRMDTKVANESPLIRSITIK